MTRACLGGVLTVAAMALVLGCGAKPKPKEPEAEVVAPPAGTATPAAPEEAAPTKASVSVDEKIAQACDLPTPRFAFDSANVEPQAASVLDAVAKCFTSGPLKGKGMKLVGHADPRGELQYNFALGHRRAGTVAQFLIQRGLPLRQVSTSSRGELDAGGMDEEGWQRDRRVEILLAE